MLKRNTTTCIINLKKTILDLKKCNHFPVSKMGEKIKFPYAFNMHLCKMDISVIFEVTLPFNEHVVKIEERVIIKIR